MADMDWGRALQERKDGASLEELSKRYGLSKGYLSIRLRETEGAGCVTDVKRTCLTCGTDYYGRGNTGYCGDMCRLEGRRSRGRVHETPTVDKVCTYCNAPFTVPRERAVQVYCGSRCGYLAILASKRKPHEATKRKCDGCGAEFEYPASYKVQKRFCSMVCSRRVRGRDQERRRRARMRGVHTEAVDFAQLCRRDRWKCQLCGEPVKRKAQVPDPLSPTLDHIIPLAKGGTHEAKNVQLAHFRCNALKRDRELGQLRFIG